MVNVLKHYGTRILKKKFTMKLMMKLLFTNTIKAGQCYDYDFEYINNTFQTGFLRTHGFTSAIKGCDASVLMIYKIIRFLEF